MTMRNGNNVGRCQGSHGFRQAIDFRHELCCCRAVMDHDQRADGRSGGHTRCIRLDGLVEISGGGAGRGSGRWREGEVQRN
jgi:hypothetical protein